MIWEDVTPDSLVWRWQQLAAVMGTLLVRSYEQSERVYKAMRLRGYGQGRSPNTQIRGWGQPTDLVAIGLCATIALALVGIQLWQPLSL